MMRKLIPALIVTCFFSTNSYSQLMHSLGVTMSVLDGKITDAYNSSDVTVVQSTFTYFPRYNFLENENSSISVGLPLGIGIGISSNSYGDDAGIAFAYDLPVAVDYNIGCKSTSYNENTFGGYFGVGFGYYKVSISQSAYSDFKGATYGPMIRGGVRIGSVNENWNGHAMTIGVYYKKGLEKEKFNTIGFNILVDL